jgi:hypothetical protein
MRMIGVVTIGWTRCLMLYGAEAGVKLEAAPTVFMNRLSRSLSIASHDLFLQWQVGKMDPSRCLEHVGALDLAYDAL